MIVSKMKDLFNDRVRIGFWTIKSIYHFIRLHRYNKEGEAVMSDFVIVIINLLMLLLPCMLFGRSPISFFEHKAHRFPL